jgi:hypothetical protein
MDLAPLLSAVFKMVVTYWHGSILSPKYYRSFEKKAIIIRKKFQTNSHRVEKGNFDNKWLVLPILECVINFSKKKTGKDNVLVHIPQCTLLVWVVRVSVSKATPVDLERRSNLVLTGSAAKPSAEMLERCRPVGEETMGLNARPRPHPSPPTRPRSWQFSILILPKGRSRKLFNRENAIFQPFFSRAQVWKQDRAARRRPFVRALHARVIECLW